MELFSQKSDGSSQDHTNHHPQLTDLPRVGHWHPHRGTEEAHEVALNMPHHILIRCGN